MDQSEIKESYNGKYEIAIISMAGRFPNAKNVEKFWENLREGVESISVFTDEEMISSGVNPVALNDPHYVKAGTILEDIDLFDASFFGFNPREAEITDPQQRLFLECTWEALESAGYDSETYSGSISLYAGVGLSTYSFYNLSQNLEYLKSVGGLDTLNRNDKDFLSTIISYKLNLRGPSISVQTACSTSLVAVHLACQSLLNGESDIALAGGISLSIPQKTGYLYQEGGIHSSDGHCRAFDANAQGCVPGQGMGVVVLKRLEDALADGDCIHAVIKGSAINNDGSLKIGYTAPSIEGQREVISEALALAGVEPETITYIETHGTGTALGDPIEFEALTQAFSLQTNKKGFCAIGSVKTNIGHLNTAAGVAGLIKTILELKHKLIVPSLHFKEPNPKIDFANSPFYVNTKLSQWKTKHTPRRAGVTSLGVGGTNAHIILEEAPAVKPSDSSRPWQLLLLSANTSTALETATANLLSHLQQHLDISLADVTHTLQVGRRAFDYRRMVVCQDVDDVLKTLSASDPQQVFTHYQKPSHRPVLFMFPGQGAQYVNMGRDLYQSEPIFREQVNYCCELLKPYLGIDLCEVLYPSEHQAPKMAQQLRQTAIAQPALFVIEYALAQLWIAWGVCPEAMIGHSIGEYVAACLSGVFSLEDALALVAARGQLIQQLPNGGMLSVQLPQQDLQRVLARELSIAANNAPSNCVVSGPIQAIQQLQQQLQEKGIGCRQLHTSHAFHSEMMESILEPFIKLLQRVVLNPPKIPFVSNVSGTWITEVEATDPYYWARHIRQPVRFSEGVTELMKIQERILLEVGPGRTLTTFAKQHQLEELVALTSLHHPQEQQSDVAFLLNTLGKLWLYGVKVDWSVFYAHEWRHRIPLPTYPFERQRYWIEADPEVTPTTIPAERLQKKPDIADWFYVPSWKRSWLPTQAGYVASKSQKKSCWLIFIDTVGVGEQIAQRLEQEGHDVINVTLAEQFTKLSDRIYAINPQISDDYDTLLKELSGLNLKPNAIAHFWSLIPLAQGQSSNQFFCECQNLGFYSLLLLAQALGKQEFTDALKILVITDNVHEVNGSEKLCPEKATVLGICKVIPQEYPNITCGSIDVVIPSTGTSLENQFIDQLLAELTHKSADNVVAYRHKHRWIQTFEPVQLEDSNSGTIPLKEGGVYLITGGLGGVGLVLAEYLAKTVRAQLVLIGRTALPPRHEWSQWLTTHDEQNDLSRKIQKVLALEALGACVLVLSADVASFEQMQAAISQASKRFGQIHGIIHAAGIKLFRTVQQISRTECESQLRSTGYALFVLEKIVQGKDLDFCLLISSLASVLGVLGMAAYPATHIFTDAFAHKHNQASLFPWLSINYDNWITQESSELVTTPTDVGFRMTRQEGLEAFKRVLSISKATQVIISTGDLHTRIKKWIKPEFHKGFELTEKVNSSSFYSRPNLQNLYVAPRDEVEQTIANIWQELLGIEQVGIHDNFFELGGDSVLGIQVSARGAKAGFRLTPQQLFEYQTIAELAVVASTSQHIQTKQGLVTGVLPLTPIQHWFFEQNQPQAHHWNLAVLVEVLQVLAPALLEQALRQLLIHHDALRLRFIPSEFGWQQINAKPEEVVPFTHIDLSTVSKELQLLAIETTAAEIQASLNLSSGPIVRVAFFELGVNKSSRMLIVIHHLVLDFGSWRILLEDLQTAYQQLREGKAIQLPQKTTSFKQWSLQLKEYAHSEKLRKSQDYWLGDHYKQVCCLPIDYPESVNTVASTETLSVVLSENETQALLQEVPAVYRTNTQEVLLTALVQAFAQWTGIDSLLVDVEGNGREATIDRVDISRTVGFFTTIYPVLLDLEKADNPGDALKVVKEQLRCISNEGIDYGVLRYLSDDAGVLEKIRSMPQADVIFLYLGQFGKSLPQSTLFKPSGEESGPEISPQGTRSHLLKVTGSVTEGRLVVSWKYSKNVHRRETIEKISQNFVEALKSLITHCQSQQARGYTPSDFSATKISPENLSRLLDQANQADKRNSQ